MFLSDFFGLRVVIIFVICCKDRGVFCEMSFGIIDMVGGYKLIDLDTNIVFLVCRIK